METTDRAERVAELVESAFDLDAEERINFLDRACEDDADLRAEVESLLKFQTPARTFIEEPAYQMAAETLAAETGQLQSGDDVGGYKIRSLLGEGGMGEVYLADDVQFGRAVAIKLIKRAFGRASFLRQFEQEERILAGLNHPNIARLYGGAVTSDGLPYFVMEYVEGERLDDFCERKRLTIGQRLEIFRKICSAVSYAHQNLIIHRDLKPGNIRVTSEAEPKLLDFGIAKLLDDAANIPEQTVTLASAMTPEYASPEQVRGERMTTASDVYSLGVILYELLTGEKPFRLTSRRPEEISRAITEQIPARPSAAASNLQSEIKNQKSLRGDLDNIVLMAMRKEPERRYASVGQFSEDIRRHLAGLPVAARKDTWSYRSGKFIRRHKVGVVGAVLVALTLLAGILTTSWEAQRAEKQRALAQRRFDDVRRIARSLMFEIHDSVADLPGSTPTRQLIVNRALEYLNNLAQEADDPSLLRELASAYVRVGNVQGNPNNSNLGDTSGALESFQKAKRIADQLLEENPNDAQARRQVGVIDEKMCDVQSAMGDLPGAVANAQHSLAAFKSIAESNPSDVAAQQSLAISHLKTGDVLGNPNFANNGDKAGALSHYESSLALLQSLPPSTPNDFKTRRLIALVQERFGTILEETGRIAEAETHYRDSQTIRQELAEQHPENTDIVRDAAIADEKIANVQAAAGNLQAALESRQRSLEIFLHLAEADPKNVLAQQSLGISYLHLADLLGAPNSPNFGRPAEAIADYQRALELLTRNSEASDAKNRAFIGAIQEQLRKLRPK